MMRAKYTREQVAELTSSLGAGIPGAGIGILLEKYLGRVAFGLVALGGVGPLLPPPLFDASALKVRFLF